MSAQEFITVLWSAFDEVMEGTLSAVVAEGGGVILVVEPDYDHTDVQLVFQELEQTDLDKLVEAVQDRKKVVFYWAEGEDEEGNLNLRAILTNKEDGVREAFEKLNKHIRETGGINLTGKDLLGVRA